MEDPQTLAQETILDNLAPQEAARLAKVRNIGIAVSSLGTPQAQAEAQVQAQTSADCLHSGTH